MTGKITVVDATNPRANIEMLLAEQQRLTDGWADLSARARKLRRTGRITSAFAIVCFVLGLLNAAFIIRHLTARASDHARDPRVEQLERLCFQLDVKAGIADAWLSDPVRTAVGADMKLVLDPLVALCHPEPEHAP